MAFIDLFITRDPQAKPVTPQPQKTTVKAPRQQSAVIFKESGNATDSDDTTSPTTTQSYNSGNATQDALDYFNNLLKEKNFPGTDYYEFVNTLNNKAFSVIPDEQARYNAVFAGLSTTGLTKDGLLDTANKYIALIDEDLQNIDASFKSAYQDKVQSKRDTIAAKNKQMQDLSKQIQQLSAEATQLGLDATESENTLNSNKSSLISAGNMTKDNITANIEKITNFL